MGMGLGRRAHSIEGNATHSSKHTKTKIMKQDGRGISHNRSGRFTAICACAAAGFLACGAAVLNGDGPVNHVWPGDDFATIQSYVDEGGTVVFNANPGVYDLEGNALVITRAIELIGPEVTGTFDTRDGSDSRIWSARLVNGYIEVACAGENATDTIRIKNLSVYNHGIQYIYTYPWGSYPYTAAILHRGILGAQAGGNLTVSDCYVECVKPVFDDWGTNAFMSAFAQGVPGSDPELSSIQRCHLKVTGFADGDNDVIAYRGGGFKTIEVVENITEATAGGNRCQGIDFAIGTGRIGDSILVRDNHVTSVGFGIGLFNISCYAVVEYNVIRAQGHPVYGCITVHYNRDTSVGGIVCGNDVALNEGNALRLIWAADHLVYDNVFNGAMFLNAVYTSYFEGNRFVDLVGNPLAAIYLRIGEDNYLVKNSYRDSGMPGWEADGSGGPGCVLLGGRLNEFWAGAVNNLVKENGGFPHGTNATKQVLDLGMNNRVVGHPANKVLDPGIGQRIQELNQAMEQNGMMD